MKLTEREYRMLNNLVVEKMENAKAMSEIPEQRWKEAWRKEYEDYKKIWTFINCMPEYMIEN